MAVIVLNAAVVFGANRTDPTDNIPRLLVAKRNVLPAVIAPIVNLLLTLADPVNAVVTGNVDVIAVLVNVGITVVNVYTPTPPAQVSACDVTAVGCGTDNV